MSKHGEWLFAENQAKKQGMIPAAYVEAASPAGVSAASASAIGLVGTGPRLQSEGRFRVRATKSVKGKSPNHLTFNEGDVIVITEQFPTGWWRGELNGRSGLLPKVAVAIIKDGDPIPPPPAVAKVEKSTAAATATAPPAATATAHPAATATATAAAVTPSSSVAAPAVEPAFKRLFTAKAEFDYTGTTENELTFKKGDDITIYQDDIPGGWWMGELNGKIGHAPAGYLKKLVDDVPPPVAAPPSASPVVKPTVVTTPTTIEKPTEPAKQKEPEKSKVAEPELPPGAVIEDPDGQMPRCPFRAKALYDYTAVSDAELSLKEGEEFRIVGFAQLGWCTAERDGKLGHVPRGWVSPLTDAIPPPPAVTNPVPEKPKEPAATDKPKEPEPAAAGIGKAKALFDFTPQGEGQLALKTGDVLTILSKQASGGWWQGELGGVVGYFPESFVKEIDPSEKPVSATVVAAVTAAAVEPPKPAEPVKPPEPTPAAHEPAKEKATITAGKPPPKNMPVVKARVTHGHKAKDKNQVSLNKGDIVTLLEMPIGELWTVEGPDGKVGLFPKGSVKIMTPEEVKEKEKESKESKDKERARSRLSLPFWKKEEDKSPAKKPVLSVDIPPRAAPEQAKVVPEVLPPPPPPAAEQPAKQPEKVDVPPPAPKETQAAPGAVAAAATGVIPASTSAKEPRPMPTLPAGKGLRKHPEPPAVARETPAKDITAIQDRLKQAEEDGKRAQEQLADLSKNLAEQKKQAEEQQEDIARLRKQIKSQQDEIEELKKSAKDQAERVEALQKREDERPRVSPEEFEAVKKRAEDLEKLVREEATTKRVIETQLVKLQAAIDAIREGRQTAGAPVPPPEGATDAPAPAPEAAPAPAPAAPTEQGSSIPFKATLGSVDLTQ